MEINIRNTYFIGVACVSVGFCSPKKKLKKQAEFKEETLFSLIGFPIRRNDL